MLNKRLWLYSVRIFIVIAILITLFMLYKNVTAQQQSQFHSCFAILTANKTMLLNYVNWTLRYSNNLVGNCSLMALNGFGQEELNRYNISVNLTELNAQYIKNRQTASMVYYVLIFGVLLLLILILTLSYIFYKTPEHSNPQ